MYNKVALDGNVVIHLTIALYSYIASYSSL